MKDPIPALVMCAPAGASEGEVWMAAGKQAAAADLLRLLRAEPLTDPVYCLAAEPADRQMAAALGAILLPPVPRDQFHFGQVLAGLADEMGWSSLAYFGGASAPLMTAAALSDLLQDNAQTDPGRAIVNNLFSTDWALIHGAGALSGLAARLPADNQIGWVLQEEAGFQVRSLPPSALSRLDLDTPADLMVLIDHPQPGPSLQEFLAGVPQRLRGKIAALRQILQTPASSLSLIGRSSAAVLGELERRTRIWVRVFIEERGMVASGRMARGEVHSLVAGMVEMLGCQAFVTRLSQLCDGALWDNRVWMAHRGGWPSAADRFASDLGWAEQVSDPALRELTEAVEAASIPILMGGHGVVSGAIYALLEQGG